MEDAYARPTPIIETYSGKLRGYNYDGVNVFKNIKYATAERWALPVPYQWEGIRECNEYGYIPIQPNNLRFEEWIGNTLKITCYEFLTWGKEMELYLDGLSLEWLDG